MLTPTTATRGLTAGWQKLLRLIACSIIAAPVLATESDPQHRSTQAYFGELHIHSAWSFDSMWHGVASTPEDAYLYNTGKAIKHPSGKMVQANQALDFMAVTDHAEYMGFMPLFSDPTHALSQTEFAKRITDPDFDTRLDAFLSMTGLDRSRLPVFEGGLGERTLKTTWQHYAELADKYYRPGEFTTFVGFEWSSLPDGQNLHRNVIFENTEVPEFPYSSLDSANPEDLWDWLDNARRHGSDVLAIPHNPNISNGLMFDDRQQDGSEFDAAYAEQRMRNEPLVELTQIKGTSETIPSLSPLDEWAGFEILTTLIGRHEVVSETQGSYVRKAYRDGLVLQESKGFNPFRFGVIGSSDGHNSTSPVEENNYTGKLGRLDSTAEKRRGGNPLHPVNAQYSASGLVGVWAEDNTREAVFAALKRKETFATSGPRILVRLFASFDFSDLSLEDSDWARQAYHLGIPMGGDLAAPKTTPDAPSFVVAAVKDPASGWLQRIQIIKGWEDAGESFEQVYDVACSDNAKPDPTTHRCPDNGASVDLRNCDYSRNVGDSTLTSTWQDPNFNAHQHAFYYARVLENPSCRWTTWDAIRNGWALSEKVPATLQERAWSSPIWYRPRKDN